MDFIKSSKTTDFSHLLPQRLSSTSQSSTLESFKGSSLRSTLESTSISGASSALIHPAPKTRFSSEEPAKKSEDALCLRRDVSFSMNGGGSAEEWDLPLTKQVENFEWLLADALLAYRGRVEEAIGAHMEAMEHCESKHELQVANLKAENEVLRDKLGLGCTSVGIFQNVVFSQKEKPKAKEKVTAIIEAAHATSETRSLQPAKNPYAVSETADQGTPRAKTKGWQCGKDKKNGKPVPGGSWQQFVAWVPSGAALQQPEPWKPLPSDTPLKLQMCEKDGTRPGSAGNFNRKDGTATDSAAAFSRSKTDSFMKAERSNEDSDDNDDDGDDSRAMGKGEEQFRVLKVWRSTEKELSTLRRYATIRATGSGGRRAGGKVHPAGTFGEERSEGARMSMVGSLSRKTFIGLHSLASTGSSNDFEDGVFDVEVGTLWVMHPHSRGRILWDLISLVMVMWDMVMVPLSLFNLDKTLLLVFMDWVTRLFWSFDMACSMRTAVILKDGTVNFEWKFILKRYFKTWFLLDSVIVGSDWLEVFISAASSQEAGDVASLSRAFRSFRGLRLLRLARMREVLRTISERVQSDAKIFVLSILKIALFVICFSHVTACIWWGIGNPGGEEVTWATKAGFANVKDVEAQYLIALHWSLCQFTGGMDEVSPQRTIERFFAVLIWLLAFVATVVIFSNLAANMTQQYMINGTQSRQLATLRKYLKQQRTSSNLTLRMLRSAQHAISGDLTQDAVELLPVVTEPLRVEMHFEMYTTVMRANPFFAEYIHEGPQVMRRVCHYGTGHLLLSSSDVVFSKGEAPTSPKMYFVFKGSLEYKTGDDYDEFSATVTDRNYVAEAVLWTRWTYKGTLTATSDVKLASLDAQTFQDLYQRFKEVGGFDPKVYAADFVAYLNRLATTGGLITDLTQMKC